MATNHRRLGLPRRKWLSSRRFFLRDDYRLCRRFARLVSETEGLASVKETNIYRTNAVWIGNIEINFTEFKKDTHGGWSLEEGWKPL